MKIRVVLDANIYASALMKADSTPAYVLRRIVDTEKYELVLSQDILMELQRILFYPKVRGRINKTDEELLTWLDTLSMICHIVVPRHKYDPIIHDDPDDDIYLIAAFESKAKYIVSGDQHILKLGEFEGIKIKSAADFLQSDS